jgi:ribulose-bisphosphate carboxylase large chain
MIALEQTVELPDGCYPEFIEEQVVGRVEQLRELGPSRYRATISFSASLVGDEIPQLLNLLFGNISMQWGVRITGLELPQAAATAFGGPRLGVDGFRRACPQSEGRPLVCTAVKPVGLSTAQLADRCLAFARGGIDVIKDEHSVTNQAAAPFHERVHRCQDAVQRGNTETGGRTLYFPNITCPRLELSDRVAVARAAGCSGALVSPFVMGLDSLGALARSSGLLLLTHPTFAGTMTQPPHGIAPPVLFGTLLRLLGADAVIYVNAGGRFPVTEDECLAIADTLRKPLENVRRALPVPGGGVDVDRVDHWTDLYGTDVMFLIGSSLYAQQDPEHAAARVMDVLRNRCSD